MVHSARVDFASCGTCRGGCHHSFNGSGYFTNTAIDDGVCGSTTPSTTPSTSTPPPPAAEAKAPPPDMTPDAAPVEAPEEILPETGITIDEGIVGGVEGGMSGGVVGGIVGGLPSAPPPPPPPPAAPIRVGGNIRPPTKVRDVAPIYPPIAQSARVQGIVIIEAIIGADGRVQDATVLRGIPLLNPAALLAVQQWEFTPTLLNGVPVPVIMTVTVNFTLQG